MSSKTLLTIVVIFIMLLVLALCCIFGLLVVSAFNNRVTPISSHTIKSGSSSQIVAVVDLKGVITEEPETDIFGNSKEDMTTSLINTLESIKDNDNVKVLLLRLNTPGGEVYATRRIYNEIMSVKDSGKKVVVLMEDEAASGGYYLSSAADKIIASEMTLTGSIGVVFSSQDLTGLYDKLGIKEIHVANSQGKFKVLSNLTDPNSESYKLLQGLADDYYNNFVEVVANGRHLTKEQVIKLADGRVYSGRQAKANGLVDELGEMKKAQEVVVKLANLDDPAYILYSENQDSADLFSSRLISSIFSKVNGGENEVGIKAEYILQY